MRNRNHVVEALQTFIDVCGDPVEEDTAEIVDPTPLQCFVDNVEDRSTENDSREKGDDAATQ